MRYAIRANDQSSDEQNEYSDICKFKTVRLCSCNTLYAYLGVHEISLQH